MSLEEERSGKGSLPINDARNRVPPDKDISPVKVRVPEFRGRELCIYISEGR